MAVAVSVALAAHLVEIAMWALVFMRCGEFRDFAAAFYGSAENYTTLGYGDVVMSAAWRLMGPLEAADGMLMFGVTTAMIFAIIHRLTRRGFAIHSADTARRGRGDPVVTIAPRAPRGVLRMR